MNCLMSTKRKPRGPSKVVQQGTRVLARVGGRQAVMYHCVKAGGIIAVESPAERVIAQLADLDPRVAQVKQQPFTLDVATGRFFDTRDALLEDRAHRDRHEVRTREYTPDLSLLLTSGRSVIIEAKDERYPGDETYLNKLDVARTILRANGLELLMMTMLYEPDTPTIFNANLLSSARAFPHAHLDLPSIAQRLESRFGEHDATLAEFVAAAGVTLRDAPILVLRSIISTDLKATRLGADSKVRLAYGDLSHFELLPL